MGGNLYQNNVIGESTPLAVPEVAGACVGRLTQPSAKKAFI
jgi:hypothetical protein